MMHRSLLLFIALVLGFLHIGPARAHVKNDHKEQRKHVAHRAKERLGAAYCWGGTSGCYDCSGFTYRVFQDHGANLPHSSTEQWAARHRDGWRTVGKRGNLKKGDLVFFEDTYKAGVSHVGIYIRDGKFIHTSDSGVRRDSLRSDYYRSDFKAGVRPKSLRS